jgi:hypothetical protein
MRIRRRRQPRRSGGEPGAETQGIQDSLDFLNRFLTILI